MGRPRITQALNVVLNGRPVGVFSRAPSGAVSFTYALQWLADGRALPVSLSLPLREQAYTGQPVNAVFENLLPDNHAIRRRVAEQVGADGIDAFSLLAEIGRDCVGALQFIPDGREIAAPGAPEHLRLTKGEVASILRDLKRAPLGVQRGEERDFRISIAGAQEKTALFHDGDEWCLPKGATPTTHILKPAIGRLPNGLDLTHSVENEHFCLRLCRELGLEAAETEILDFEDIRVIAVKRFDRLWARDGRLLRVPQEDFCQALPVPPTRKYNNEGGPGIAESLDLLTGSDEAAGDRRAFTKAQIIFWLMGATDGHAKNFSVFITPGGRFRMTPIYDVMSAEPNLQAGQLRRNEYKLAMAVGDRRNYPIYRIHPRHFLQSAKAAGLPDGEVESVFEDLDAELEGALERAVAAMPGGFPAQVCDPISDGMRSRIQQWRDYREAS